MPKKKRDGPDLGDINLVPIMAILCILIPVILYAFNFFEIKIQAVAAPRMGQSKSNPDPDQKKPLNLTVLIAKDNFTIKQTQELSKGADPKIFKKRFTLEEPAPKGAAGTVTVEVEEYNYPALYSALVAKKKEYPNETTVNVGAEMDIPWKTVARTIDACRVWLEEDKYEELALYRKARTKRDRLIEEKCGAKPQSDCSKTIEEQVLFPAVVFVVAE